MKRLFFNIICLLIFISCISGYSKNLYVISRVCPLLSEPTPASSRLVMLKQGEELTVIETEGKWIKVKAGDRDMEGYVQDIFTGEDPSVKRKGKADNLSNVKSISERKRSSAYTTSVAATRGLSVDDNVRARENLAFSKYDFSASEWLDQFTFTEDEILLFAELEGIGL